MCLWTMLELFMYFKQNSQMNSLVNLLKNAKQISITQTTKTECIIQTSNYGIVP